MVPKVGKTTRPVGHSSTCTSDLYRRRVRLSRLCSSAGRAVPGLAALGPAGPDRTSPCGRAWPGRPRRPRRAGPRRAVTGARPGFGTRQAARLRRTRPGRASACDRRPGFGTRPGFGAHDRARFRHATGGRAQERDQASAHTTGPGFGTPLAQLIPRRRIGFLSSFSSISPTINLLRSPNASSPHLASGSLLLSPFTRRSVRKSVEKNVDRHLRFPNWSPVDGWDFVVFLSFSDYHPVKVAKCLARRLMMLY